MRVTLLSQRYSLLSKTLRPRTHPVRKAGTPFQTHSQLRNLWWTKAPDKMSLTYYTFGTPNGLKPAIVLEELGLDYKAETVDISKNTQKEDWYLAINPNGRIPALKVGDLRVFETCAIMLYLTDKHDPKHTISYEHGSDLYYEMLSWIMWQQGGLGKSLPCRLPYVDQFC